MGKKPCIVVMCATERDKRELSCKRFTDLYDFYFHQLIAGDMYEKILCKKVEGIDSTIDPCAQITQARKYVQTYLPDGIISSEDYPGSVITSIIGKEGFFAVPSPCSVLLCQHKYFSRKAQQRVIPKATPQFCLVKNVTVSLQYPFFIKPIKGFFSFFALAIHSAQDKKQFFSGSMIPDIFMKKFNWFVDNYASFPVIDQKMIAEELLIGGQYTYEAAVQNRKVQTIGVTDSIMFPGTNSFSRFEYPSLLTDLVQNRMHDIAQKFASEIGLDDTLFNIEFMYDDTIDRLTVIEINARMASQFADLYEKVDGVNSYQYAIDISLRKKIQINKSEGKYAVAASCVLRTFTDKKVIRVPTEKEINHFYTLFPDGRFQCYVTEGQMLSDIFQDGSSYRYGLIHLGAQDRQELLEKFAYAKTMLPFKLC